MACSFRAKTARSVPDAADSKEKAFITAGGLLTDELEDAQLGAAQWEYDRRTFSAQLGGVYAESPCGVTKGPGIYRPIQTARYQADVALKQIKEFTDAEVQNRITLLATAALYSGFSHMLLGEAFCTTAISAPDEVLTSSGSAELGQPEVFALAEAKFSEAIGFAMELYQRGMLSTKIVDGLELKWGKEETVIKLIHSTRSSTRPNSAW